MSRWSAFPPSDSEESKSSDSIPISLLHFQITGKPWYQIEFTTTDRGKPYMLNTGNLTFGMNISHHVRRLSLIKMLISAFQGNYTVFSSSCSENIGVDVMKIEQARGNQTPDEYISFMAKSFSSEELRTMRSQETDLKKMTMFYRYWVFFAFCFLQHLPFLVFEGIHFESYRNRNR